MGELRGLPGVKRRALAAPIVRSINEAMLKIARRRAVTAAGSEGALNVWRDDAGRLRSEFMRFRAVQDSAEHEDEACLRAWLNRWWPKLERDDEA